LVTLAASKHRLQYRLRLKERFDLVLKLLLLDIHADFIVSEEPLTDLEFVLPRKAFFHLIITYHAGVKEHLDFVADSELVCFATFVRTINVERPGDIIRQFE